MIFICIKLHLAHVIATTNETGCTRGARVVFPEQECDPVTPLV